MRERIESLKAIGPVGENYEFSKYPLLRYSDADRDVMDASLWAIGHKGRPNAVAVLEIYGDNTIQFEFTATSELPKSVQGNSWRWEPRYLISLGLRFPSKWFRRQRGEHEGLSYRKLRANSKRRKYIVERTNSS